MSHADAVGSRPPSLLLAVSGTAWAALGAVAVLGGASAARVVDHAYQPAGVLAWSGALALFLVGWAVMTSAMMLPSTATLVRELDRFSAARPDRARVQTAALAGWLGVWVVVGVGFRVFDVGVHQLVGRSAWLEAHSGVVLGAVLVGAGAFELSSLKHRCLTACRSPRSFLFRFWRGGRPGVDALRVGAAYGVSCVGCCWALMLVVFALGAVQLAWMAVFAGLMTLQKTARWGPALATPAAILLLGAGIGLVGVAVTG